MWTVVVLRSLCPIRDWLERMSLVTWNRCEADRNRVVVDARYSGSGIGRRLYDDRFEFARARGIGSITCEYNIEPPNPASRAFRARFGFKEIGTQWGAGDSRQDSLQAAETGYPS